MTRFPDWQGRLSWFFTQNRNRPFEYGTWDCCLFAADAIKAMTGTDIAAEFRGRYANRTEAYALIGSVGSVAPKVAKQYGMPQVPISYARRGDMALIERARDYSLGIISLNGKEIAILRARGIVTIPLSLGFIAWHG